MADGGLLVFATKGDGSNDEVRILGLLADHAVDTYAFDRDSKAGNVPALLRHVRRTRPRLIVMEGTGVAGGTAVLLARTLFGVPYVVSSGDAVGPFLASAHPAIALPAHAYERLLYRRSAGFIGWTPYLVGRAFALGARRGVTAASWTQMPAPAMSRNEVRAALGVRQDALLFGIVGSLDWNASKGYCYGLELVKALHATRREDVAVAVVGGGSGLDRLRDLAGDELGRRIFVPGAVEQRLVTSYLAAMDVGSLPQTLDEVGALRYTTKISEYVSAGLPLVTGRLPLAYDLADRWSWRLPGAAPWSGEYIAALASLMSGLAREELEAMRARVPSEMLAFDRADQRRRVGAFVADLLEDLGRRG